jgi:HK97 family phage portal protein
MAFKPDTRGVEYVKSSIPPWLNEHFGGQSYDARTVLSPQEAWQVTGWLRRCIDIRAQAVADIPFALYRENASDPIWLDDGERPDELDWLKNLPNYLWKAEASLTLKGAAYALKRIERGRDAGLQWLSPLTVEPEYGPQGITRFKRQIRAQTFYVPTEMMLHAFSRDPFVEIGPGSTLERAAHLSAEVMHSLNKFADNFLDRGMIKASLVTVPPSTSKDERDRLETWWQRWFRGTSTETKVVSTEVQPVVVGGGLNDLADVNLTELSRQEIGAIFGVPESMLTSSAANFATAAADQVGFYQWTILPEVRLLFDALNEQYLGPRGYWIEAQPERIEAMARSHVEKAQAVFTLTGGPVLTTNEARAMLGYDPVAEGDVIDAAPSQAQMEEVRAWRRKVKAKGRDVAFDPHSLNPSSYAAIKARLESGVDLDQCFEQPWRNW